MGLRMAQAVTNAPPQVDPKLGGVVLQTSDLTKHNE